MSKTSGPARGPHELPGYLVVNSQDLKPEQKDILTKPAAPFTFPLSKEDKDLIETIVAKYKQEENCAGLAGPQIGIPKQVITSFKKKVYGQCIRLISLNPKHHLPAIHGRETVGQILRFKNK